LLKNFVGGVSLGGNIGVPVTSLLKTLSSNEIVVLESSSFQLETIKKFHPHIAVIMNITEDHLNRHGTMSEYIRCKYRITKNQTAGDYLILNADDEILRKNPPKTKAKIFYFSTKRKVCGSYLKNGYIYFNDNEREVRLVDISKLKLKGDHNLSNVLAATLSVFLQTRNMGLLKNISEFQGVPHRIEFVKNVSGVGFYNDSKATNIASTLVATAAFSENVNLILGGSDKGYDFGELFKKLPKNVTNIAVFGETRNKIAFSAKVSNYNNIYICDDLEDATRKMF
jgi:UDP-N-acetylmuramoylalanine--D-glutamate ligase